MTPHPDEQNLNRAEDGDVTALQLLIPLDQLPPLPAPHDRTLRQETTLGVSFVILTTGLLVGLTHGVALNILDFDHGSVAWWIILVLIYGQAGVALLCLAGLLIVDPGHVPRTPETCYPLPPEIASWLANTSKSIIGSEQQQQQEPPKEMEDLERPSELYFSSLDKNNCTDTYCTRCLVWRRGGAPGSNNSASKNEIVNGEARTVSVLPPQYVISTPTTKKKKSIRYFHCNTCQRCVSHFDHHCSFFGRCIAGGNIKFFYGLIGVGLTAYMTCLASILAGLIHHYGKDNIKWIVPIYLLGLVVFNCYAPCLSQMFMLVFHPRHCMTYLCGPLNYCRRRARQKRKDPRQPQSNDGMQSSENQPKDDSNNASDTEELDHQKDLFLSPEERYDVYCVKSSERPHLLLAEINDNINSNDNQRNNEEGDDEKTEENDEPLPLPLMDGCDIPGWRAHGLVPVKPHLEATLNVGLGCTLLRRERQLPLPAPAPSTKAADSIITAASIAAATPMATPWEKLRDFLLQQPTTSTVERIDCNIASQIVERSSTDESSNNNPQIPQKKRFSKWEEANYPVIITDCCTTTNGWNKNAWEFDRLVKRYEHVRWRFSDTHGAMMALGTYAKYVATEGMVDDSPLAVYDSEFGESDSPMHDLVNDYVAPPCFSDDLFALTDQENDNGDQNGPTSDTKANSMVGAQHEESDTNLNCDDGEGDSRASCSDNSHASHGENNARPPWRWILMGPPRSGTGLHIDPLWTNAWVTLLEGVKRWILIPPQLTDKLPEGAGLRDPQVPSVIWFRDYYEQVIQLDGVVEILQQPGETVFVPNGWPHLVLNLDRTVSVTHNYASEFGPFERMWEQVVEDEPEFSQRWYRGLCKHRPDLASRIHCSK